jgi:2-amino-4-hydroxy-6-hydroxymethyldihydropteridine diphosphokinase
VAHTVYIGLGSNIKPAHNLKLAVAKLAERTELLAVSSAWKSPPVGSEGPEFLNAAAKISTHLSAAELKERILRPLEAELGRVRGRNRFAPRPIDLDILLYDQEEIDGEIWDFAYVAAPLSELVPGHQSRVTSETISEAAARLQENQPLKRSRLKLV